MTLATRALRNSALSLGGAVVSLGAAIFVSAVVARTLGPARMADFTYAFWWATVFGSFANLGLPPLLTKYVAEYTAREETGTAEQIVRRTSGAQLIAGIAGTGAAVLAMRLWWKDASLGTIVAAAALVLPFCVQQSAAGALVGLQRYDRLLRISLAASATKVVLVLMMAELHASTAGMLAVFVGGSLVEATLTVIVLYGLLSGHQQLPSPTETVSVLRRLKKLAAVAMFISLSDAVVWERSEAFFLKQYARVRDLADYGVAFELARKAVGLGSLFANVLLPIGCEAYARGGDAELRRVYNQSMKYMAIAMCPLAVAGVSLAPLLVVLSYGGAYRPAVFPLQILLSAMPVISVAQVGDMVVFAKERQPAFAPLTVPLAVLNIFLAWLLVRPWGASGAALANALTQVSAMVIGAIYMERMISVRGFPWRTLLRIALAAAASSLPIVAAFRAGAGMILTVGAIVLAGACYLALLAALREISPRDVSIMREAFGSRRLSAAAAKGQQ